MSRSRTNKSVLTSAVVNPQLERQARRLARQAKQLDKELVSEMTQQTNLTGAKGRSLKYNDFKKLTPLTDTQEDFFNAYEEGIEALVLYGCAGTGKSTIGLSVAVRDVLDIDTIYDKIIIIRSSVQSRDQGFLPGTMEEKMEPFEAPYHGIFEFLSNGRKDAYQKLKDSGKLEFISSSFLRGSTFDQSIIVVDEIQSMTWHELSTIASRVGKNSKIIFMGDSAQNDLITKKLDVSGFRDFMAVSKNMAEFRHFKFTTEDIIRSGFCKSWIISCEKLGL